MKIEQGSETNENEYMFYFIDTLINTVKTGGLISLRFLLTSATTKTLIHNIKDKTNSIVIESDEEIYGGNEKELFNSVKTHLEGLIQSNRNKTFVLCTTLWSTAYSEEILKIIGGLKEDNNNLIAIAGGPSLQVIDEDYNTMLLKYYDFLNIGGGKEILKYLSNLEGTNKNLQVIDSLTDLPKSIIYKSKKDLDIKPGSQVEQIIPGYDWTNNGIDISLLDYSGCPKSCAFCVEGKRKVNLGNNLNIDLLNKELVELEEKYHLKDKKVDLFISDPNPTMFGDKFWDRLKELKVPEKFVLGLYPDALSFQTKEYTDDFIEKALENELKTFFFGRDAIKWKNDGDFLKKSSKKSRKTKYLHNNDDYINSKKNIKYFLKEISEKSKDIIIINIAYIFHPGMNLLGIVEKLEEIEEFKSLSNENLKITEAQFILKPNPGTDIAKDYGDYCLRDDEYSKIKYQNSLPTYGNFPLWGNSFKNGGDLDIYALFMNFDYLDFNLLKRLSKQGVLNSIKIFHFIVNLIIKKLFEGLEENIENSNLNEINLIIEKTNYFKEYLSSINLREETISNKNAEYSINETFIKNNKVSISLLERISGITKK